MQWLHCSSCAGSHAAHQWKASQRELLFTLLRRVVEVVRAEWIVAAHAVRGVVVVNLFGAARDGIVNRDGSVTGQLDATAALVVRARKLAFFGVLHSGTHIAYPDTRVVEPGRGQRERQELYIEQLVWSGVQAARAQGAIALGGEHSVALGGEALGGEHSVARTSAKTAMTAASRPSSRFRARCALTPTSSSWAPKRRRSLRPRAGSNGPRR